MFISLVLFEQDSHISLKWFGTADLQKAVCMMEMLYEMGKQGGTCFPFLAIQNRIIRNYHINKKSVNTRPLIEN